LAALLKVCAGDNFSCIDLAKGFLIMNDENTLTVSPKDQATQIAAIAITCLLALMWAYFGRLYLIADSGEIRIVNQELGYPLYIIPLIGVTHILGAIGLLIPNVPRLTEWVYAGLTFDLLLACYSRFNSGGNLLQNLDPIVVLAFVIASYLLRCRMHTNQWSI
jgi:hypothetical protein